MSKRHRRQLEGVPAGQRCHKFGGKMKTDYNKLYPIEQKLEFTSSYNIDRQTDI